MDRFEEAVLKEYITLVTALKCLPGVMPNKSKRLFDDLWWENIEVKIVRQKPFCYKIGKTKLKEAEFRELYIEPDYLRRSTVKISPKGAKILLKLYNNGDLIMKKGSHISNQHNLQDYINKENYFKKRVQELKDEEEHENYLIENPKAIKESDFTYELLNKVFCHRFGYKQGDNLMVLDGILVRKSVVTYKSNSGKTRESEVVISWTDSNGKNYELSNYCSYKNNRRNDAERNWGLPE